MLTFNLRDLQQGDAMTTWGRFNTFLLFLLLFPFIANATKIVAEVGDKKITDSDFFKKFNEASKTLNPPTKEQFLEDLVRYEVGLQEAKKKNFEQDPIVQDRFNQILYVHLIETELGKKANGLDAKESEMKEYYKSNPELRTSHIFIQLKPGANGKEKEIAKKRAKEIYAEVKKSKRPFEELVKLYSDDSLSKPNGGDIGWQSPITLANKDYYEAAKKLKLNEVSGIVETSFGFHIIKLTGVHKYDDADKVKIRGSVLEAKKKALFDKFFDHLKSKYKIKTFKENL